MRLLNNLFRSKALKQFERALKKCRYEDALKLCNSNQITASRKAEAQYKFRIYNAIATTSLDHHFKSEIKWIARFLQNEMGVNGLPAPEQTAVRLSYVTAELKNNIDKNALDQAVKINSKEGRTQAIQKIVTHMVCRGQPLNKIVEAISSIPIPANANELLRNLLLSKVLLKDFDAARKILPHISHDIRRSLRPQIDFVEHNHDNLEQAQQRARGLIHPDDIALTLALVAGAMGNFAGMSKFSRSVSAPLLVGTHATYSASLAYSGRRLEAIALLENIQEYQHEYYLRLSYLAFNIPFSQTESHIILEAFSKAENYEGALAHWFHNILEHLVSRNVRGVYDTILSIQNDNLRNAVGALVVEFAYAAKSATES